MNDAGRVGATECARGLGDDLRGLAERKSPTMGKPLEQVFAVQQLHHDKGWSPSIP